MCIFGLFTLYLVVMSESFCEWQVAKLECEQQLQDIGGNGHWFIGC